MKDTIQNLFKIKSLWSIVAMAMFVFLTVTGTISGEVSFSIITAIITYYFTKKEDEK